MKKHIDMRKPKAWKELTPWQRWMVSLNDRFNGKTARILEDLAKQRGFKPEPNLDWSKYCRNPEQTHEMKSGRGKA